MKERDAKLEAAYEHFAKRVGRLLVRKGAACTAATYKLNTPGGPLILWAQRNWIFGRFENPVGGFIVSGGLSQQHSGRWATNFADDADTLKAEDVLRGFEYDLDQVLGFALTDEQRKRIHVDGEIREREAAMLEAFFDDCQSGDRANVDAWLGPNPKVTAENWQYRHAPHVLNGPQSAGQQ